MKRLGIHLADHIAQIQFTVRDELDLFTTDST
jgi:hypothetical protein